MTVAAVVALAEPPVSVMCDGVVAPIGAERGDSFPFMIGPVILSATLFRVPADGDLSGPSECLLMSCVAIKAFNATILGFGLA